MQCRSVNRLASLNKQIMMMPGQRTFAAAQPNDGKVIFNAISPAITEIKLNMPKSLNSLDIDMARIMADQLVRWHKDPSTKPRATIMSGVGGKSFCAGGDIVSIYKLWKDGRSLPELLKFFEVEYQLDYCLSQTKDIERISLWNGYVMGGGVGLTWHSPVRIATDNSMYAMPETAIGFFTDVGGSYFLPRVKNGDFSLGLYLGLTGQRIIGRDLVKYGIATHFIKQENLDHLHEVLLKNVTKDSTTEEIEDIVQDHSDATAAVGEIKYHDEIRQIFQNDSIQACMDRLEQSNSEFASMTKKMLAPMSPLSLAVVFEQIKRGSKMSIKEVFEMEFKIAAGFCQHTEFFEGVRALLVDKDKQPKWRFKTVHQITPEHISEFFDRNETINLDLFN